jgi:DNA repair protein RadA/Sms
MVSAYISGEEAVEQVQLRGKRLALGEGATRLAAATNIRDIIATLETGAPPDVVVIDSIQTMYLDTLDSAPGTVAQVRSCAAELIRVAKRRGFARPPSSVSGARWRPKLSRAGGR